MSLPRLTGKNALSRAPNARRARRAEQEGAPAAARGAGIEPALCPDPNTPLETDYKSFAKLGPVDLAKLAQTSTTCRDVVYDYVMAMWDAHCLWGNVYSLPVTAPKVLRAWNEGEVGKACNL